MSGIITDLNTKNMFPVKINRSQTETYREGERPHYKKLVGQPQDLDLLYKVNWTGFNEPIVLNMDSCQIGFSAVFNRIYTTTVDWSTVNIYHISIYTQGHSIQVFITRTPPISHTVLIMVDGVVLHNQNEPLQTVGNGRYEIIWKPIGYTIQVGDIVYSSGLHLWTGAATMNYRRSFFNDQGLPLVEVGTTDTWFELGANTCHQELQIETTRNINFLRLIGDKKSTTMFNEDFYKQLIMDYGKTDNPRFVEKLMCLDTVKDFKAENKVFIGYVSAIHSDGQPSVKLYSCDEIICEMIDNVPTQPPCVIDKIDVSTLDGTFCRVQLIGYEVSNLMFD